MRLKEWCFVTTAIALLCAINSPLLFAQYFSSPVRITSGSSNDIHPTLANAPDWWFAPGEEWLAFSRNGKNIHLTHTAGLGARWPDTTYALTTDSMDNDFPSLTRTQIGFSQNRPMMLVWQSRKYGNLDIFYSHYRDTAWSAPRPLSTDPRDDQFAQVVYRDSGFAVVWERAGRILFSEFVGNQWSPPEFVTPPGDTLNTQPDVFFIGFLDRVPLVVWERSKAPAPGSAIMFSFRTATGWMTPDTVWATDDNHRPRFFKVRRMYLGVALSWSSTARGQTQLLMRDGDYTNSAIRWNPVYVPPQPPGINAHAAFNGTIIVTVPNSLSLFWSVGVWSSSNSTGRGQILALPAFIPQPITISSSVPGFNRHPDVASGIFRNDAYHIWCVWENNQDSVWKLYGCYASFSFFAVDEKTNAPGAFVLHQNYPNPFNPVTTIGFRVQSSGRVILKVYDVLGREVATLVDGIQDSGFKAVEFDGSNLPSGIYFYRLQWNGASLTRKALLLR